MDEVDAFAGAASSSSFNRSSAPDKLASESIRNWPDVTTR
jgi:hypothetical protein